MKTIRNHVLTCILVIAGFLLIDRMAVATIVIQELVLFLAIIALLMAKNRIDNE